MYTDSRVMSELMTNLVQIYNWQFLTVGISTNFYLRPSFTNRVHACDSFPQLN